MLLLALVATLVATVSCGKYTVTDEVWFEVQVKNIDGEGNDFKGRFTIALFGESAPMTVMNFVSLTRGYKKGKEFLHYKNTPLHRIVPDFVLQMGDITIGDGTGGKSIFGAKFNDEEFILSHRSPGWVSMANHGRDTNGSQFFIMLTRARWLDGKHVVFGKVIKGFDVLKTVGEVPSDPTTALPKIKVTITDCGVNDIPKKYDIEESQLDSTDDL
jgi:cyclophilin family peptidyl-prolyl cis-trans isomerase